MTNSTSKTRKPSHRVVAALPRGEGNDPYYQKIGAGWESEKGTIWLSIELMPTDLNVSIGIRPITENDDEQV